MIRRTTLRELFGVALVIGAAMFALAQRGHDQKIIQAFALPCVLWICMASIKPWSMRTALVIATATAVLAIFALSEGLGVVALIPLAVTVHHVAIVAWEIYQSPEEPRVALREGIRRQPTPRREPPPKLDDDPFRSLPQAPPIVVRRAPTAPSAVPIERDENAAKPKLLG